MDFSAPPYRFIGYGAAVGEVLQPFVSSSTVDGLYSVTALFVLAHTIFVLFNENIPRGIFTLLFELLASAAIPTFIIIQLTRIMEDLLSNLRLSSDLKRYTVAVLGLCVIFMISAPLDKMVTDLLNSTVKKVL